MDVLQHTYRRRGAGLMDIQILRRFRVAPDERAAFDRSVVGKRRASPDASAEYAAADQRSSRCKEFSTLHDTTPPEKGFNDASFSPNSNPSRFYYGPRGRVACLR